MLRWIREYNPDNVMLPRVELERFDDILWIGLSLKTRGIDAVLMFGVEIPWTRPRPFILSLDEREFTWSKPRDVGTHDHACCPPDDCCGGPCAAHPHWELTT